MLTDYCEHCGDETAPLFDLVYEAYGVMITDRVCAPCEQLAEPLRCACGQPAHPVTISGKDHTLCGACAQAQQACTSRHTPAGASLKS